MANNEDVVNFLASEERKWAREGEVTYVEAAKDLLTPAICDGDLLTVQESNS